MQWMWKIKWCSSLLLFSSFLEPATLPFVHEHMQVKIGLLAKLGSTLAAGQLHSLLGCQLVSLKMKCSVPGKLNMFSYLPLVWKGWLRNELSILQGVKALFHGSLHMVLDKRCQKNCIFISSQSIIITINVLWTTYRSPWGTWSACSWPPPWSPPCLPTPSPGSRREQQSEWSGVWDVTSHNFWAFTLVNVLVTSPQCTSYSFPYISSTC